MRHILYLQIAGKQFVLQVIQAACLNVSFNCSSSLWLWAIVGKDAPKSIKTSN
ncbi:MAG: hypothetical protein MJY92_07590 [Bacteroidales bacterium]|nr:hypothetical protein [Bacteroidales bacterium]